MTVRVPVQGALLAWAQRRSRVSRDKLLGKFPALEAWEAGEKQPTLKQLEQFAPRDVYARGLSALGGSA